MSTLICTDIRRTGETAARSTRGIAAAWVNFTSTATLTIRDSLNVSSVSDNGVGIFASNRTNNMADADYAASGHGTSVTVGPNSYMSGTDGDTKTTAAHQFRLGTSSPSNTHTAGAQISHLLHGDLA